MNRDDLFPVRTDRERAEDYLHRRRPLRPQAEAQTEALFPEPEHQQRRLVPPPHDETLFPEPDRAKRRLVGVEGWPDYAAQAGTG